jgi:dienelactone hydrolase
MTQVILFHHAQGRTPGILAFADELRAAGHDVTVPDLYDGATFETLDAGMAHLREVGSDEILARGVAAAAELPPATVYAGFSLGAMSAQKLAQTRPGAKGAVLVSGSIPLGHFGEAWPSGVPLQLHTKEGDDWGDRDVAEQLAAAIDGAELYLYPGDRHLWADRSLPDYDPEAATLLRRRVVELLERVA